MRNILILFLLGWQISYSQLAPVTKPLQLQLDTLGIRIPSKINITSANSNTAISGTYPNFILTTSSGGGGTSLNGTGYVKMSGTTPSYSTTIPNSDLTNSSININGSNVALGGSITVAGGGGSSPTYTVDTFVHPLEAKANFTGFWHPVVKQGLSCMSTINTGSDITFFVQNTVNLSVKQVIDAEDDDMPFWAYQIDNDTAWIYVQAVNGIQTTVLSNSLDPTKQHKVRVILVGMSVKSSHSYFTGIFAFNINDIIVDALGICIPLPKGDVAIFDGDSITQAAKAAPYGTGVESFAGTAIHSYPQELGDSLNVRVVQHGFSGTGLFATDLGVPGLLTSAFYYEVGAPINLRERVKYNFINIGTNDNGVNISTLCQKYDSLIAKKRLWFPQARIVMIIPMALYSYQPRVDSFKACASRNGIDFINAATYEYVNSVETHDGIHPTTNGHIQFAKLLYRDFKAIGTKAMRLGYASTVISNNAAVVSFPDIGTTDYTVTITATNATTAGYGQPYVDSKTSTYFHITYPGHIDALSIDWTVKQN